jgi:hypothetical protein
MMATLPSAKTAVQDTAAAVASGIDTIALWSPCAVSADCVPRLFGSAAAIYAQHGYCEGVEYAALHAARTRKPILFSGLPIATPGAVGRVNTSGNTGTSVASVAAGSSGVLAEHEGRVTVLTGGTVGTSQIVLGVSLDDGTTVRRVRLGTATSYALPFVGVTLSLAAGGTLVAGDTIITWYGSAPKSDATGWATARAALAAQLRGCRTVLLCGDLDTATEAQALVDEMNSYETANERFTLVRASVRDRAPLAALGAPTYRMTGAPTNTFAEVGETGDTITRSAGSFIADGFQAGDLIVVTGSAGNNITAVLANVAASVLTLDSDDLVDEGPVSGVTIVGHEALVFDAAAGTVTRSRGSWLDDGFRVGDSVTVAGSVSNDGTRTVAAVTAAVLDLGDGLVNETIRADAVTVTAGQTKAAWMAAIDAEFASIDAQPRIDLSAGRGRVMSPFSSWARRTPAGWFASCREYQHDLHVATWRKSDGPVGASLLDADGNLVEWDDRVDGGAGCAARFTTLRTWANGPGGAFVAMSLTRAADASLLSQTHNAAVVNLACMTVQLATENVIGRSLTLNADGTATREALNTIATEVNAALGLALLTSRGEGPRASSATWTPSSTDVLNVAEAVLTGVLELNLNGTIHSVDTRVRVVSGGQ